MLPQKKFLGFKGLRSIAKGLGFKYVWHTGGRLLARRKGGERAHAFATAADLQTIQTPCQTAPKRQMTMTNSTDVTNINRNNVNETQGAALAMGSVHTSWLCPNTAVITGTRDGSFLNVNSLRPRIEKLRLYLSENPNYHFFGIAESWLGPVMCRQSNSYWRLRFLISVLRQDRNVNGDGVALYVRNDFQITVLTSSRTKQPGKPGIPEYLFCELRQGISSPILIGAIYRPPHVAMQKDTDLFPVLQDLSSNYSHKCIMGDMGKYMEFLFLSLRTKLFLFDGTAL